MSDHSVTVQELADQLEPLIALPWQRSLRHCRKCAGRRRTISGTTGKIERRPNVGIWPGMQSTGSSPSFPSNHFFPVGDSFHENF